MSYILDALRKSEQQRQATQPDSVADRILVSQPQSKSRSTKWLATLLIGNLLIITYLLWFFTHRGTQETPQKIIVQPENQQLPKPLEPQPASQVEQPTVTPGPVQIIAKPTPSDSPTIAQLIENTKTPETPKPVKKVPDKKLTPPVKETTVLTQVATRKPAPTPDERLVAKPQAQTVSRTTEDLNDLSYEVRNNLPSLNINVFSYADNVEDRFVIIDMVKYKTGQLIKGIAKLKEIRPDCIIVESGNHTFRVERP